MENKFENEDKIGVSSDGEEEEEIEAQVGDGQVTYKFSYFIKYP
jgi:hypothetical protein